MKPRILLVNPRIYDFAAHDFWLRPYGLLRAAGYLRGQAELRMFDYLDSSRAPEPQGAADAADRWGRRRICRAPAAKPAVFAALRRRYRRFAFAARERFREFLADRPPFDAALVQTGMTYWYPGVAEVIEDLRRYSPATRIVLGGVYATLCPQHARRLGADLVILGADLDPLWRALHLAPDLNGPALWEAYERLGTGVLKLTDGCPFRCTYCAASRLAPQFVPRPLHVALAEMDLLRRLGARNVAFYDDALLFQPQQALLPFLDRIASQKSPVNFHTPNALHARLLTREIARLMVRAGVRTFYLGFESLSDAWQRGTDAKASGKPATRPAGKVAPHELACAVAHLREAGADPREITVYLILGHPRSDTQELEASMRFAHALGVRLMLADFSPIPGTPDGDLCRQWVDMDEPLCHNKSAFPIALLGEREVERLKELCRRLNSRLPPPAAIPARGA
jgi:hypothetical protein